MIKNIILIILVGLVAFLLISKSNKTNPDLEQAYKNGTSQDLEVKEVLEETKTVITPSKKSLDLHGKGLDKLPSSALSDTSIEVLDISDNNLTGALPSEIGKLKNLKVLDASNNSMTGVPAEVGQLTNLEILDLSNNQLTGLPYELGNLKNLKKLNLSGNSYSEQDLNKIKESLPSSVDIIL